MKKLGKMLRKSIVFCFVMFVICAFIYPFALTGISQLTMKNKANGNLIDKNGEPISNAEEAVGSELIGQDFAEDYFFHGRVSAVNYNTYTEDKKKPLTDDELADILKEKGYPIARRTVAKYRQQLNIPVARLRK